MTDHLSKWWAAHLAWLSGVVVAVWPSLREYICSHPIISGGGIGGVLLLAILKQSPLTKVKVVSVFVLASLFGGTAKAQTPAPQPIFSISTQAVALHIGGQTVAGTDAVGSFNLTPNVQLQSDNILAPANNFQGYFGGAKWYAQFLSKPFEKTSLSDVAPYVHVSLGIVRNVPAIGTAQQHYGALVDAGFDYRVNGTFSVGPRAGWLNAPGFGPHPNGYFVSANLNFVLGKK